MLTQEQHDFYTRWLAKADNIYGNDIGSLIDKYVTLFINYNFLYNIIPEKESQLTGEPPKKVGDRKSATTVTIDFVGAKFIAEDLAKHGLDAQIENLIMAMPHFNIDLDNGKPQPKKDKVLIKKLMSPEPEISILALMNTLYFIRCNIVHGEKRLHQYQEELLLPAIQLLRAIVQLVYEPVNG